MKPCHITYFLLLACAASGSGCSPDDRAATADLTQRPLAEEHLGSVSHLEELFRVGHEAGFELHRVRAAAILSSGEIAIADAGNHRVAVFSSEGTVQRSFGRAGDGPSEFRNLVLLSALGDTIVTFDNIQARIALWTADGSLIGTHPVPTFRNELLDVRTAISTDEYIATTRPVMDPTRSTGIFTETVDVVRLRLASGEIETLTDLEWRQLYQYVQDDGGVTGVTVYSLPFLGQSRVVGGMSGVAFARFSDREVELLPTGMSRMRHVQVPLTAHPFDSRVVEQYRDSLIEVSAPMVPAADTRLRRVFGTDFPSPAVSPTVGRAAYGTGTVWLEQHPEAGGQTSTWYAIAMDTGRLLGEVILPTRSAILGGDESSILVHSVDDLGVETVVRFRRPPVE